MQPVKIEAVLTGKIQPLGESGVVSAINKKPVRQAVMVTKTGIVGDEQAELKFHGGPEKALHHYPQDHYPFWQSELPKSEIDFKEPGAFGENIATFGLSETNVNLGDIWRVGDVLLEVCQARQPCWKLNLRFGTPHMSRRVQETKRTGWYYRVLAEGKIEFGDKMILEERPHPTWDLAQILYYLYDDTLNEDAIKEIISLTQLSESWRKLFTRRLETKSVEDWEGRLMGSESERLTRKT